MLDARGLTPTPARDIGLGGPSLDSLVMGLRRRSSRKKQQYYNLGADAVGSTPALIQHFLGAHLINFGHGFAVLPASGRFVWGRRRCGGPVVSPPRYKKVPESRSLLEKRLESLDAQMKNQPHESACLAERQRRTAATKISVPVRLGRYQDSRTSHCALITCSPNPRQEPC